MPPSPMRNRAATCAVAALLVIAAPLASAHAILFAPSTESVSPGDQNIEINIQYTHPMTGGPVIHLERPLAFGVIVDGERTDLLDTLEAGEIDGNQVFRAEYTVGQPGAHIFYMEADPYYANYTDRYHFHYAKTLVDSMGAWSGWDEMAGFPLEIEPLVRPYGLWTGNVFQGIVRADGEPAPGVEIEVEYLNEDGVEPPTDAHYAQVLRTDANGVFTYAMPRAGWWGFTATVDGEDTVEGPDGEEYGTQRHAILWVKARDMQ